MRTRYYNKTRGNIYYLCGDLKGYTPTARSFLRKDDYLPLKPISKTRRYVVFQSESIYWFFLRADFDKLTKVIV